MEATEGREILKYEYVQIYTNGYGNIVLLFEDEKEKPLAVGQKMYEINREAYMNGYNWDAFLNYYLAENAPDICKVLIVIPKLVHMPLTLQKMKRMRKKQNALRILLSP